MRTDQSAAWLILINWEGGPVISLGLRAQLLPLRVPAGT